MSKRASFRPIESVDRVERELLDRAGDWAEPELTISESMAVNGGRRMSSAYDNDDFRSRVLIVL